MGWSRVIGIVGGLGPHAHVRFESLLLATAEARSRRRPLADQDNPPYLLSSIPQTPDRTDCLLTGGLSPVPLLERSLRRLEPAADFAIIVCNAAHAFLSNLRALGILPLLDIVAETTEAIRRGREGTTIGILATTGTLEAGVYSAAFAARSLEALSLLELPGGARLQEELVMGTIYGDSGQPGIKAGAHRNPGNEARLRDNLIRAARLLAANGAQVVLTACTEIPLVLRPGDVPEIALVDPLQIAANEALALAAGERELSTLAPQIIRRGAPA